MPKTTISCQINAFYSHNSLNCIIIFYLEENIPLNVQQSILIKPLALRSACLHRVAVIMYAPSLLPPPPSV
jgi:hypothetical protein